MSANGVTAGEMLTARQVCSRQQVSIQMVKKALKNGRLRGQKVGERGDWRISAAAYAEWVAAGMPTKSLEGPAQS